MVQAWQGQLLSTSPRYSLMADWMSARLGAGPGSPGIPVGVIFYLNTLVYIHMILNKIEEKVQFGLNFHM